MADLNLPEAEVAGDLVRIHSIITRALDVSIERSRAFAESDYPDADTRKGFIIYIRCLATILHAHHLTEDELVFPYFKEKMPDVPFEFLTAQHQEMVPAIDAIKGVIRDIEASTQAGEPLNVLNQALTRMHELWLPHIREEESHLSSGKIGAVIDMDERVRLSKVFANHARKHSRPVSLIAPFILFNLTDEDRAVMSRTMPWIATQVLIPFIWKSKWKPMLPFLQ